MCLLGAGLGYFAYSNRRMRTRFVTKMGKIRELKFKSSQRCENTLKLNSRNNWFRFREFTAGHYSSATGTATLIDDDDESPIIRGFRWLSFISSFQKIWFLMSHLFQWWRALSHVRDDQLWLTVIKQRGQRKKATAHICTDSDGGLVTIYCDLDEQLMMPCEVIHFFFPPGYPPVSFLRGLCWG